MNSCACGCGEKTRSKYRKGHWSRSPEAREMFEARRWVQEHIPEPNPSGVCQCGCGEKAPIAPESSRTKGVVAGKPLKFIQGHAYFKNKLPRHRITDVDVKARTGTCNLCGPVRVYPILRPNKVYYRCEVVVQPYRAYLKDKCERCGFVPEKNCQLDVHHRDGDRTNNRDENLMTICANCHRLHHYTKVFE